MPQVGCRPVEEPEREPGQDVRGDDDRVAVDEGILEERRYRELLGEPEPPQQRGRVQHADDLEASNAEPHGQRAPVAGWNGLERLVQRRPRRGGDHLRPGRLRLGSGCRYSRDGRALHHNHARRDRLVSRRGNAGTSRGSVGGTRLRLGRGAAPAARGFALDAGAAPAARGFALDAGAAPAARGFAFDAGAAPAARGFAFDAGAAPAARGFAFDAGAAPAARGFAFDAGAAPAARGFAFDAGAAPAARGFALEAGAAPAARGFALDAGAGPVTRGFAWRERAGAAPARGAKARGFGMNDALAPPEVRRHRLPPRGRPTRSHRQAAARSRRSGGGDGGSARGARAGRVPCEELGEPGGRLPSTTLRVPPKEHGEHGDLVLLDQVRDTPLRQIRRNPRVEVRRPLPLPLPLPTPSERCGCVPARIARSASSRATAYARSTRWATAAASASERNREPSRSSSARSPGWLSMIRSSSDRGGRGADTGAWGSPSGPAVASTAPRCRCRPLCVSQPAPTLLRRALRQGTSGDGRASVPRVRSDRGPGSPPPAVGRSRPFRTPHHRLAAETSPQAPAASGRAEQAG